MNPFTQSIQVIAHTFECGAPAEKHQGSHQQQEVNKLFSEFKHSVFSLFKTGFDSQTWQRILIILI